MSLKNRLKKGLDGSTHKAGSFFEKESWSGVLGGFERPHKTGLVQRYALSAVLSFAVLALLAGSYYFWNKANSEASETVQIKKINNTNPWYAVKLVDGDVIYGKITDINTDPLVIDSVYYNYDQKRSENDSGQKKPVNETGDLRLVKRGNETHGPDGKLQVFRAQVVFMENLRADSKVLRVIEENEKQ
jgi:hypothetical protein